MSVLSSSITEAAELVRALVDAVDADNGLLTARVADGQFSAKNNDVWAFIGGLSFEYSAAGDSDAARAFNEGLDDRTRDFVATRAVDEVLAALLDEVVRDYAAGRDAQFGPLCVLLDWLVFLVATQSHDFKKCLYSSFSRLVAVLLVVADALHQFWGYFESRLPVIETQVFSRAVVADRISILEMCNPITDQFYAASADSYKKDSFNDKLQSRVRVFVNRLLSMDDNTGLNKFFKTAGRSVPVDLSRSSRDSFMADILECQRVFNDPYHYLKQGRVGLNKAAQVFERVYEQLIELEQAYLQRLPKPEPFLVKPETRPDPTYLSDKYAKKLYIPEHYWISGFNKNPSVLEKERQDDQNLHYDMFDQSNMRRYVLLSMFIVSNLYIELTAGRRRDFLKALGGPATTKHIVDQVTPDASSKVFGWIKREMPKAFKAYDHQFMYLLQHLSLNEEIWFGWLVYGKDPATGKSWFADRQVTPAMLGEAASKFATINAPKEKRYFNVYATPQLSRKMRTPAGLAQVKIGQHELDSADSDSALTKWRRLRSARRHRWFDAVLAPEDLPADAHLQYADGAESHEDVELESHGDDAKLDDAKLDDAGSSDTKVSDAKSSGAKSPVDAPQSHEPESLDESPDEPAAKRPKLSTT